MTDWIAQLSDHVGIGAAYRGFGGEQVPVSQETRTALLHVMGHDVRSEADAQDILTTLREDEAARPAPMEAVVIAGKPARIDLRQPVEWRIEAETGSGILAAGSASDHIAVPALPSGIHRLVLSAGSREWVTWVLARPEQAVSLADVAGDSAVWGVTAPIYGLTDKGAAPIGNYDLLADYAAGIAAHGADFIGINPVHAMGHTRPGDLISPYSPSHREFLNTWHIPAPGKERPVTRVSDVEACLVDYPDALANGHEALVAEFRNFRAAPEFSYFLEARDPSLEAYALFEVLADRFGADWQDWPAEYRHRNGPALASFSRENRQALDFYKWSQWQADCHLAQAHQRARNAGMRVGLYLDLAVGPRMGGAETWDENSALIAGVSLGAPPDALAPNGQRWGLAPMSPHLCRAQGYAGFARLLRSVMRHAGMIRIDHIIGLMRSYWIPQGADAGAYVSYPFEALLAVVAIESARSGVIVIGEDLGLVPDGLREKLAASGIYGLDVMQYMRDEAGGFQDMGQARQRAVCAFATHDTPTIEGFFAAEDAKLQISLGTLEAGTGEQIIGDRNHARDSLGGQPPVREIHARLARARSEIVAVQLDDIAHQLNQQNVPGTVDEYPNWRRITPFAVEEIRTSDTFASLGDDMRASGRANPRKNGDGQ